MRNLPITLSLIMNLFFFGFTLWLGAYLLAHASKKMTVRLTGFGLLFFALALAGEIIWQPSSNPFLLVPALFWIGAALYLIPEDRPWRETAIRAWALAALPTFLLTLLNRWFALIAIAALLACALMIARLAAQSRYERTLALLTVIGLFFTISTSLLFFPLNGLPRAWVIPLVGLDLVLLGIAITIWDAFDEGETIRTHLVRSFVASLYYGGALTALIILAVGIDGQLTRTRLIAFAAVIAFAVLTQTFSNRIETVLDRLTLPRASGLNDQRKMLRETADHLPRLSLLDPSAMDEIEFTRLTRRAISYLGDLPKLSASPLINLPAVAAMSVDNASSTNNALSVDGGNPLERTRALKSLIIASILRLKPAGQAEFGVTEEWRYFNALYYPYVKGIKPYTQRVDLDSLDASSRQALEWFQRSVPERTLHNWQNAAARLIAAELRNHKTPS